jgi:serine/threonine protein phosphatase 1
MPKEQRAIIGDLHGEVTRLNRALEVLVPMGRELIFVGDYINKGPDSREVVDVLVELKAVQPQHTFLRGNHDDVLLRLLNGGSIEAFIRHGGLATIASYTPDPGPGVFDTFSNTYPYAHYEFLQSTSRFYEVPGLFVSHAGYDPRGPKNREDEIVVYGRHSSLFHRPDGRPQDLVVFGHYVQSSKQPYDQDGIVCIDTGCGTLDDGPLTVLLLPEHSYLQF